ncbi:MAG: NAD(P)H-binding protein [Chitinophagaceae bacterium]
MKYVITGGAGHISKPLALTLLKAGHQVTVVGRNAQNLTALTGAGATAAIGSLEDEAFLQETFKGADAVYTMVPPMHNPNNWKAEIGVIGEKYARAIKAAGIKYVVNLSSIGAHLPDGVGPVSGLYLVENALNKLTDVNILHLRPAYFYHNLLANISLIRQAGIIGANFSLPDGRFPIVHPADIAAVAAEELLKLSFTGHGIRYIASDETGTQQIASTIGQAIGKPDLPWVAFTTDQAVQGMTGAGLPLEIARNYAEMNEALGSGKMTEDYWINRPALAPTRLGSFVKEFAAAYRAE